MTRYVVDLSTNPPTCFPEGLSTEDFVDATRVEDAWRRFLDIKTGTTHDCAEYARLASLDAAERGRA